MGYFVGAVAPWLLNFNPSISIPISGCESKIGVPTDPHKLVMLSTESSSLGRISIDFVHTFVENGLLDPMAGTSPLAHLLQGLKHLRLGNHEVGYPKTQWLIVVPFLDKPIGVWIKNWSVMGPTRLPCLGIKTVILGGQQGVV